MTIIEKGKKDDLYKKILHRLVVIWKYDVSKNLRLLRVFRGGFFNYKVLSAKQIGVNMVRTVS